MTTKTKTQTNAEFLESQGGTIYIITLTQGPWVISVMCYWGDS